MSQHDLILVGGGLANTLIALKLVEQQPKLDFLLLEKGDRIGGNHTWSFHGSDMSPEQLAWLAPLIEYEWQQHEVRFPELQRTLPGSYHSITSERLAETAHARLGARIRTEAAVKELHADKVILEDGRELATTAVIDGRGPSASPHLDVRFQKFVGQIVQLENEHGLQGPIIMDATAEQDDGYRFIYTLPFSANVLLIEDTHYSDTPGISTDAYGNEIHRYAVDQGWQIRTILREEEGVLPITLGGNIQAFWDNDPRRIPRSGLRAALFQPATGYSLPNAIRLADLLANHTIWTSASLYQLTRGESERLWRATGFYRILNRMLFLAAAPEQRRRVLERFYGLNFGLIKRFYAGNNTMLDKARLLMGKPPVPLGKAWQAVFRYRP